MAPHLLTPTPDDVFAMTVRYYCQEILPVALNSVDADGVFWHRVRNDSPKLNRENSLGGAMIITNGNTLTKKLVEDELIDPQAEAKGIPIRSIDDFTRGMDSFMEEDGAFVYDATNHVLRWVGLIDRRSDGVQPDRLAHVTYDLASAVPYNFSYYDGSVPPEVGARTDTGIRVSKAYPHTSVVLLKESKHSPFGLGPVVRFKCGKLAESFVIGRSSDYADFVIPFSPLHFFDEDANLVALHSQYCVREDGRGVRLLSQRMVTRDEIIPTPKEERPSSYMIAQPNIA
ncbi:hypothetical protein JW868_01370 [Candidatus Woesearchaeota archaeon]|nr:hypothetical protein [Candidatus Woesearchaeota archaeon]